jgi:predicted methyltransferase MtxX (methanogen marker protein 4)
MPVSLDFESPAEAKGFKAIVNIDSKVVDFANGITGKIIFKNLGVQCLAVYGCLLRKEDITATSTGLSKRRPD